MGSIDSEVERAIRAWRARIEGIPGTHVAIEALWDGDTDGWFLDVLLVTSPDGGQLLESLRYGSDFRLFDGSVPPWPEAQVALRAGGELARELGLELYFPSPDKPDDDCPHWWERDRATPCRVCKKPLLDRDLCFSCQLEEERRARLIADAPGHDGNRAVYLVGESSGQRLFLNLGHARIAGELAKVLGRRPLELSERIDTVLSREELLQLQSWCEQEIDGLFARYQPRADLPEHFSLPTRVTWRGREHTVELRFNDVGSEIADLIGQHQFFAASDEPLLAVGNGGIGYRDVDLLCRVAANGGALTMTELRANYPFLTPEMLEQTLTKLEQRRFLTASGNEVRLLMRGRVVDVAGP